MTTRFPDASLCGQSVAKLSVADPVTVRAETPVGRVIALMQEKRIGAVVVVDASGRLLGTFSERTIVDRILGEELSLDLPVSQFLAPDPLYVKASDEVAKAMSLMAEHGLRHVAVCGEGMEIVGIISVRNIIDCLAQQFPKLVINQPPRADQAMRAPEGG